MRSHSYLNSASTIIERYDGKLPLGAWLKAFFREDKRYGSRDRKIISHLCYSFYRLGNAFAGMEKEERLLLGLFLCSNTGQLPLKELRPQWNEKVAVSLEEKLSLIEDGDQIGEKLFPFQEKLSPLVATASFSLSFLLQPALFLRVRPGKMEKVKAQLSSASIPFIQKGESALQLENGINVDEVLHLNRDVVVQDLSSQQTLDALKKVELPSSLKVWDCCAASGGKSILAYDLLRSIQLTATDIRESILINLRHRFKEAGIASYQSFLADVGHPSFEHKRQYDLVICDAPCSGSGTWARTPEAMHFFTAAQLAHYSGLQQRIASNASRSVKKGGYFLYITCSVFQAENEDNVHLMLKEGWELIEQNYLRGYRDRADTLFFALLKRSEA